MKENNNEEKTPMLSIYAIETDKEAGTFEFDVKVRNLSNEQVIQIIQKATSALLSMNAEKN